MSQDYDADSRANGMIYVPKDVKQHLIRDEMVEKQFDLKDQTVFTSTKRLFIKKGNTVRDISYSHISSMELKGNRNWVRVIVGIFVVATPSIWPSSTATPEGRTLGRVFNDYGTFSLAFTAGVILLGIFLIISGYLKRTLSIEASVAGMSERLVLSGDKGKIDALFRLLNERRFQLSNTTSDHDE